MKKQASCASLPAAIYAATPLLLQVAPACIEFFGNEAIIFQAETETFLTVNLAAAELFCVLQSAFGACSFDCVALTQLLLQTYEMEAQTASAAAARVVAAWQDCGLLRLATV